MYCIIVGGFGALCFLLLLILCKPQSRRDEKTTAEVKEREDGTIKVNKTTKYKGKSRPFVETFEFPNEPTANASGYFLHGNKTLEGIDFTSRTASTQSALRPNHPQEPASKPGEECIHCTARAECHGKTL